MRKGSSSGLGLETVTALLLPQLLAKAVTEPAQGQGRGLQPHLAMEEYQRICGPFKSTTGADYNSSI